MDAPVWIKLYPPARKFLSKAASLFDEGGVFIYSSSETSGLEGSFCNELLVRVEYESRRSEFGRKWVYNLYTSSERHFLYLVMAKAYYKLIVAPFRLYSALNQERLYAYECIFEYAAKRLIVLEQECDRRAIGIQKVDEEFLAKANSLLSDVRTLCQTRRENGESIDW